MGASKRPYQQQHICRGPAHASMKKISRSLPLCNLEKENSRFHIPCYTSHSTIVHPVSPLSNCVRLSPNPGYRVQVQAHQQHPDGQDRAAVNTMLENLTIPTQLTSFSSELGSLCGGAQDLLVFLYFFMHF